MAGHTAEEKAVTTQVRQEIHAALENGPMIAKDLYPVCPTANNQHQIMTGLSWLMKHRVIVVDGEEKPPGSKTVKRYRLATEADRIDDSDAIAVRQMAAAEANDDSDPEMSIDTEQASDPVLRAIERLPYAVVDIPYRELHVKRLRALGQRLELQEPDVSLWLYGLSDTLATPF